LLACLLACLLCLLAGEPLVSHGAFGELYLFLLGPAVSCLLLLALAGYCLLLLVRVYSCLLSHRTYFNLARSRLLLLALALRVFACSCLLLLCSCFSFALLLCDLLENKLSFPVLVLSRFTGGWGSRNH
jgi:hypothetical protein